MQADMDRQTWRDPRAQLVLLRTYADQWLEARDLKPRTRADYRRILDQHVYPALGDLPLRSISPTTVRDCHSDLGKKTGNTMRSHA
ncbi:N-terminal phage integrase SAM-like domain-containing protein [Phycicoccus sp. SLBN-51]|uniref:N-terminal phage integrase SAM-like domain-containing protein n=1 Tax=Phycicoccus sp. SLBN-51 TaxID=2768447 RepID=UPI001C92C9E4|nr:N-terminal phage integrase SAM-like domain-containing protein [Phycicoccus sp. SLBN-51]